MCEPNSTHYRMIVLKHAKQRSQETIKLISRLHDLEKIPMTLNDYHYLDYKAKFLAYYEEWRSRSLGAHWVHRLNLHSDGCEDSGSKETISVEDDSKEESEEDPDIVEIIRKFNDLNGSGIKSADLARVLQPELYDPALEIMASVRAYFQGKTCSIFEYLSRSLDSFTIYVYLLAVTYKYFINIIPRAIDHELVLGLVRDHALDKSLRTGLGINGDGARERCVQLLQEDERVSRRRSELLRKQERLSSAKDELMMSINLR